MSKKAYYAAECSKIQKQGGNALAINTYLEKVCEIEKVSSVQKAAFKAAIVLAM